MYPIRVQHGHDTHFEVWALHIEWDQYTERLWNYNTKYRHRKKLNHLNIKSNAKTAYPTTQKSYPSRCQDCRVLSVFWNTISTKSCRLNRRAGVPITLAALLGSVGMPSQAKTPVMLNWSASFSGVSGTANDTPLTAYRCFPPITGAELANTRDLVFGTVP